jgi:hypothetical protein
MWTAFHGHEGAEVWSPRRRPRPSPWEEVMAEPCGECRALVEQADALAHRSWHEDQQERLEEAAAEAVASVQRRTCPPRSADAAPEPDAVTGR